MINEYLVSIDLPDHYIPYSEQVFLDILRDAIPIVAHDKIRVKLCEEFKGAEILLRGASLMLDAIEEEIPRNRADRDYGETVVREVRLLRAKLKAAEQRIENFISGAESVGG